MRVYVTVALKLHFWEFERLIDVCRSSSNVPGSYIVHHVIFYGPYRFLRSYPPPKKIKKN